MSMLLFISWYLYWFFFFTVCSFRQTLDKASSPACFEPRHPSSLLDHGLPFHLTLFLFSCSFLSVCHSFERLTLGCGWVGIHARPVLYGEIFRHLWWLRFGCPFRSDHIGRSSELYQSTLSIFSHLEVSRWHGSCLNGERTAWRSLILLRNLSLGKLVLESRLP